MYHIDNGFFFQSFDSQNITWSELKYLFKLFSDNIQINEPKYH